MRKEQAKQGLILGILAVVAMWLLTSIWSLGTKAFVAVSHAGDVKREYETLTAREAALESSLAALGTDRGRDAAIRTAFGVARPGEEVIVVVPPATTTPPLEKTWWQKVVDWF